MFKEYMSLLYVGCMKFFINWFVGNFCPIFNGFIKKQILIMSLNIVNN
jgi:hypothetical protein